MFVCSCVRVVRQSCDSITNVIVLVQFENILLRCSLIRINRNKLKGLVEILYKCVLKKKKKEKIELIRYVFVSNVFFLLLLLSF